MAVRKGLSPLSGLIDKLFIQLVREILHFFRKKSGKNLGISETSHRGNHNLVSVHATKMQ